MILDFLIVLMLNQYLSLLLIRLKFEKNKKNQNFELINSFKILFE